MAGEIALGILIVLGVLVAVGAGAVWVLSLFDFSH